MPRYREKYSVLESSWGLNKETSEIVGIRMIYFDPQMYRPFMIELLRGDVADKRIHYPIMLERANDAHMSYELYESYKGLFMENTVPLDPDDHPFIAKFIREKEQANKPRYDPGSDWRHRYGMPPIIFSSSFMRYFNSSPVMSTIGWLILSAGAIFGIWVAL